MTRCMHCGFKEINSWDTCCKCGWNHYEKRFEFIRLWDHDFNLISQSVIDRHAEITKDMNKDN